jgi:hypothetical protein
MDARSTTPMHYHDKDVVVVYLEDGALRSTTVTGQETLNDYHLPSARIRSPAIRTLFTACGRFYARIDDVFHHCRIL